MLADLLDMRGLPVTLHDGIREYVRTGRRTGDFLAAVINNDLRQACALADMTNRHCLPAILMWMETNMPSDSWGKPGAYDAWRERGGEQIMTIERHTVTLLGNPPKGFEAPAIITEEGEVLQGHMRLRMHLVTGQPVNVKVLMKNGSTRYAIIEPVKQTEQPCA